MAFFRFLGTTFNIRSALVEISPFLFFSFLAEVLLRNNVMWCNVAVDYFRPISRHGNTALINILNYHTYLP